MPYPGLLLQMDERGNSMTDASPLVSVKQALNKIKSEIADMDLRIGVVRSVFRLRAGGRAAGPHHHPRSWRTRFSTS